jgi:3-methyladenine DNA glycosylase/8-oxoguanine DNA glycosylase
LLKAADVSKPRQLREIAEAWRPWRAYAAMYLWKSLSDAT